jgi:hypothetical protein
MPINLATEVLRPLADAAGKLPPLRGGKAVSPSTVWRWSTRGVRARNGGVVRLETIKIGGTCCTSDEALARFFRTLTDGTERSPEPGLHEPQEGTGPKRAPRDEPEDATELERARRRLAERIELLPRNL